MDIIILTAFSIFMLIYIFATVAYMTSSYEDSSTSNDTAFANVFVALLVGALLCTCLAITYKWLYP